MIIVAENIVDDDADGLVDHPDDEARGGRQVYTFATPVELRSLTIVDIDASETAASVEMQLTTGETVEHLLPVTRDGGDAIVELRQAGVVRLIVNLPASGAVDDLEYRRLDCVLPDGGGWALDPAFSYSPAEPYCTDQHPDHEIEIAQGELDFKLPTTQIGQTLGEHLADMMSIADYEVHIARIFLLRDHAPEVVATVAQALSELPEAAYWQRWMLIELVGSLITPESIELLQLQGSAAVPPERYPLDASHVSSVGEELTIRFAAIRGLTYIAWKLENTAAVDGLQAVATSSTSTSVRKFAVRRLLRFRAESEVLAILPLVDRWMVTDVYDVTELPLITPPADEIVSGPLFLSTPP